MKEAVGQDVHEAVQAAVRELLTITDVTRKIAEAHRLTTSPPELPTGCYLYGPIVASTVSGITSVALTLVARRLRPIYPVLPLPASARTADRSDEES